MSCRDLICELASAKAVPGGGGAAALAGAIGTALGSMVGALTLGKAKYAEYQTDIVALMQDAAQLQNELLALMDEDAAAFAPLAQAYAMPTATEAEQANKQAVMEDCLRTAAAVPLKLMQKCARAIELHGQLVEKGARIVISDVGVGVVLCQAALKAASLNVFINTGAMRDRDHATRLDEQAKALLDEYLPKAEVIYAKVMERL